MTMTDIRLKVIPQPEEGTRTVLAVADRTAIYKGSGSNNYLCGNCDFVLLEGIDHGQMSNVVLRCSACQSHNEMI